MTDTGTDKRDPGFFIIDNEVVTNYELNPYEGWLYCVIVQYLNHKTNVAFPSLTTLAKVAKMSRPKVVSTLKTLVEKNLIAIEHQYDEAKKEYSSNHYKVLPVVKDSNRVVNDVNQGSKPDLSGVVNDVNSNKTDSNKTNEQEEKTLAPAARKQQPKKRKSKPKPRDPVYDLVGEVWFQKKIGTSAFDALGGRIGLHVTWLKGNEITVDRRINGKLEHITVQGCTTTFTRSMLAQAKADWFKANPGMNAPNDILKFVEWIDQWLQNGQAAEPEAIKVHFPPGVKGCDVCGGIGQMADANQRSIPCPKCLDAEKAAHGDKAVSA